MKLFCEDCEKVFTVPADCEIPGSAACPKCGKEYNVLDEMVFAGKVVGGDFLVESVLGKGGMGEIYLARQLSLDRQVALKILQNKYAGDEEYIQGLFHEARAAAKVNHPNVVQAYAVGEEDGVFYFAMEYIRGETFKQILQREHKIDPERALKVIRDVAGAIDAAWREQKLVHQDIKPDNIMLDANGFAKLADLGLARNAGSNDEHAQAGDEVMGTPQYISPEQLTGVPTDVRSDIYSLGATFYQFVTGRFAYVADTVEEMSYKHVEGNLEPPNTVNPDIPESVNAIIMKMMARHIEDRYQDPKELIRDIDKALRGWKSSKPSISLKLKTPFPKKSTGKKVEVSGGNRQSAPVAPVVPVAPSGVKKATPVAPVVPVAPAGVKKAAPAVAPAENNDTVAEEIEKTAPETDTPKTETENNISQNNEQQSVRSALIAKHNDAETAAEEKEELDEIFAESSEKSKKSKKVLTISLISVGGVVLLLLAAVIVTCCCAEQAWMPAFAKNCGVKINASCKELLGKVFSKSDKTSAKKIVEKPQIPVKKAPVTRKEFLEKVEKFLSLYHPDKKTQWHKAMQAELEYFKSPQTDEERRSVKPLLLIWHRVDDLVVFAPYRAKAQEARLERIRKAEEKERIAREAEEKRQREELERKAAEQAKIEQENKKIEQERQQNLARLKGELQELIIPLAKSAAAVLKGGDESDYQAALLNIKQYNVPLATNNDEQKVINDFRGFVAVIQKCVADFKYFTANIADVSDKGITIRVKIGKRRQLVQMLGLSADGTLRYKQIGGKPAETHLKSQRGIALATPLRVVKNLKNVDFYVLLLSGRPVKELLPKAPSKEWKALLSKVSL